MAFGQACGGLEDPRNADCAESVLWAYEKGLKLHPGALERSKPFCSSEEARKGSLSMLIIY